MIREIGYHLGFTKDRYYEKLDTIYGEAKVIEKEHKDEEDWTAVAIATKNYATTMLNEDEEYKIHFKGENIDFTVDNEKLFNTFEIGDIVTVGYRKVYRVTCDYVPPDFNKKKEINRKQLDDEFVSASKNESKHVCIL